MRFLNTTLLVSLCFYSAVLAAEGDEQDLLGFFQGQYTLIGSYPDSQAVYKGAASFKQVQGYLQVERTINGTKTSGTARLEKAQMAEVQVLRIRFQQGSKSYEETCLFQPDLDNYARLSCYLYQPGIKTRQPGLEAYFISNK